MPVFQQWRETDFWIPMWTFKKCEKCYKRWSKLKLLQLYAFDQRLNAFQRFKLLKRLLKFVQLAHLRVYNLNSADILSLQVKKSFAWLQIYSWKNSMILSDSIRISIIGWNRQYLLDHWIELEVFYLSFASFNLRCFAKFNCFSFRISAA